MMTVELAVTEKQATFMGATTRGNVFEGGIGAGKTIMLCRKGITKALQGRRSAIVSFSYPTLRDVVLYTLKEELQKFNLEEGIDYHVNKNEMIVMIHGTELLLRSPGNNPNSMRGPNLHDFLMDEAREFKDRAVFDVMLGRIRNVSDGQWYIATTTKGKNWVYDLLHEEREQDHEITHVRQTTYENPFLPKEYIADLEQNYTEDFSRQELLAEYIELGSGVVKSEWFKQIPKFEERGGVRFWDLAVSIDTRADYSAGAKGVFNYKRGVFTLQHMVRGRFRYPDLRRKIIETAKLDGMDCIIGVEEAGQQLGFIDDLRRAPELANYVIRAQTPTGDKFNRLMPWASRAEQGKMNVVEGAWNKPFFDEVNAFSPEDDSGFDDQLDATSGCHYMLVHTMESQSLKMRI